jgi:SHOCT-like domain
MNEYRREILEMLAEKKISAEEAERLLAAMEGRPTTSGSGSGAESSSKARAKYLRVQVDAEEDLHGEGPTKVNVRVPMQLLRAGVRLAGLIPASALRQANDAMRQQGVPIDLTQIKPENLEEIVDQLNDLTVDVDQEKGKVKVRVFCE